MIVHIIEDKNKKISLAMETNEDAQVFDVDIGTLVELKKDAFFYKIDNGNIIFDVSLSNIYPFHSPEEKIAFLKQKLSSSDYKIIKCAEAQLLGNEQPYDIVALHSERQKLRNEIESLQNE